MQVEGVAKLPDLLDKLTVQAEETRKKIKSKVEQAIQLAALVNEVSQNENDWRTKLKLAFLEIELPLPADAIAQPEANVARVGNRLTIKVPKQYENHISRDDIQAALNNIGLPDLPFNLYFVNKRKTTADQPVKGATK
jgi:hypothetical protein